MNEFLKKRFDLHASTEVQKSAERNPVKNGPDSLIQNYLDRLEDLTMDPDKT